MKKYLSLTLAILSLISLISILCIKIPMTLKHNKLIEMGFDENAIKKIYEYKLDNDIIDNTYYSKYLNFALKEENFNKEFLKLYTEVDLLDSKHINLFYRLQNIKGYSFIELEKLFINLNFLELTPLLVFDKLSDLDAYIKDCKQNTINEDEIYLNKKYFSKYVDSYVIDDKESIEAYVSLKFSIGDYVPQDLKQISTLNAVPNVYLKKEAFDAFNLLANDMRVNDCAIYATKGYLSYEAQEKEYARLLNIYDDEDEVIKYTNVPGYNEQQTGLALTVNASEDENIDNFLQTKAYLWLYENAHNYGFILRYPSKKSTITQVKNKDNYLRFVGIDLATKIKQSKLTFDEYYMLYIFDINEVVNP